MLPFSRFEARTILKLSGPIVLAQLTQTLMYFVDTVMAGRYSSMDMAAIAVASGLWLPIVLTMQGLLLALTPIIAQFYGSKQTQLVSHYTLQGLYLGFILAAALFVLMLFVDIPLAKLDMDTALLDKTLQYLYYVSFGLFPAAGYIVMRNLFEGLGNTKASMWISFVGILVNIPANYVFIYGKLGMPALGGAGCGIATSLVFVAMFIAMLVYGWFSRSTRPYRQWPHTVWLSLKEQWQIIRIGTPIACSIFFEVTLFACIPLVIVHLGPVIVAGHQVAHNYSAIVFMLPLSLGSAVLIRTGHLIGQFKNTSSDLPMSLGSAVLIRTGHIVGAMKHSNQFNHLKVSIYTGLTISIILSFITALLTYFFRDNIATLYTGDKAVLTIASSLLLLACFYQVIDAVQVVSASVLRGMKITKPTFFITFFAYWPVGFGLGYVLSLTDFIVPAMGVSGFWIGIIVGLTVAAILLSIVLKSELNKFSKIF